MRVSRVCEGVQGDKRRVEAQITANPPRTCTKVLKGCSSAPSIGGDVTPAVLLLRRRVVVVMTVMAVAGLSMSARLGGQAPPGRMAERAAHRDRDRRRVLLVRVK